MSDLGKPGELSYFCISMKAYPMQEDTICAIGSPPGQGAIAIVRVSGPASFRAVNQICALQKEGKKLEETPPGKMVRVWIRDGESILDDGMVCRYVSPNSYTGEDMAEIFCHGSVYIQQRLLQLLITCGVRLARPGEFTQRAFLNGKMDLSQAEAVADLIASTSGASHRLAMDQMRGGFSSEIEALRKEMLQFVSLLELELDFSEEDVEFADRSELMALLERIIDKIRTMAQSFASGQAIKNGIPVVIAGLPNVGKSTLLNTLLNEDRAIVSEIPGTTRDTIEDTLHIEGYLFRIIDTAGLRHSKDEIEAIGIRKTREKLKTARIVLLVVDLTDSSNEIPGEIKALHLAKEQRIILVANKTDKVPEEFLQQKVSELKQLNAGTVIPLSAKKQSNLDLLRKELVSIAQSLTEGQDVMVTNLRHFEALDKARQALERAGAGLKENIPTDLVAQDIREAIHYLAEITGEITTDEILGNIFKNFCIGK